MEAYFCPRCSGAIEFPDGAGDDAVGRCSCSVSISLGGLKRIEWKFALDERIKAVDWAALDNGEGGRDVDFRYRFAFRLGQLAANPSDARDALPLVERALFRDGAPLAIAFAAQPFLREIYVRVAPEQKQLIERLLARIPPPDPDR